MGLRVCDFRTRAERQVRLEASANAPIVFLRAGHKDSFVALDIAEATVLRDALTRFIEAAGGLAPHAEAYAARLTDPSAGASA